MSEGALCLNLTKKDQKELSLMANHNLMVMIPISGLSIIIILKLFLNFI